MNRKTDIRWVSGAFILGAASTIFPSVGTFAAAIVLALIMGRHPKSPETLVTSLASFLGGFLLFTEHKEVSLTALVVAASAVVNILIYHLAKKE